MNIRNEIKADVLNLSDKLSREPLLYREAVDKYEPEQADRKSL